MRTIRIAGTFVLVFAFFSAGRSEAQQNNFQFSPPPVPYPEFSAGRRDSALGVSFLSMSGEGISMAGLGVNGAVRKSKSEKWARGHSLGGFLMLGDIPGLPNPAILGLNGGLHLEYQFYKDRKKSFVGYAGGKADYSLFFFDFPSVSSDDLSPGSLMFGIPFGVMARFDLGDKWKLLPFVGVTHYIGGIQIFSDFSTEHIDGFTVPTFGADIVYVPKNISLGTLIQQAASSGSNEKIKTFSVTFTWRWSKPIGSAQSPAPSTPYSQPQQPYPQPQQPAPSPQPYQAPQYPQPVQPEEYPQPAQEEYPQPEQPGY